EGLDVATGFVFEGETQEALVAAMKEAEHLYRTAPEVIARMRRAGMSSGFGWEAPARSYEDAYRWAVGKHRQRRVRLAV
ncbi:MAG: glycogen synthase, partial [Myxococcales bacterium]|nr:glycogen synthase [Myxococcales bacterium]